MNTVNVKYLVVERGRPDLIGIVHHDNQPYLLIGDWKASVTLPTEEQLATRPSTFLYGDMVRRTIQRELPALEGLPIIHAHVSLTTGEVAQALPSLEETSEARATVLRLLDERQGD